LARFDLGAQVLEQLQQLGAARGARRHPDGRNVLHHRYGGLGRHLLHAVHVFVEAFTDLLADHAAGQALGGDHVGAVARLVVVLAVNRFDDVVRHVQRRQIKQFKRTELEADLVAQDPVDGGEVGNALADDAQSFGAIATARVVDDEARGVLRLHRGMAHLPGVVREALANGCIGFEAGDHLHHLHQRHGIEEVVARKALRVLHAGCDGGHRQRRSVGHQHGVLGDDLFQIGKYGLLDVDLLDDGFHHQIAAAKVLQAGGFMQTGLVAGNRFRAELALFLEFVPSLTNGFASLRAGTALGIEKPDLTAGLSSNLGDATAHGAGTDDGNLRESECHDRGVSVLLDWTGETICNLSKTDNYGACFKADCGPGVAGRARRPKG